MQKQSDDVALSPQSAAPLAFTEVYNNNFNSLFSNNTVLVRY